MNTLYTFGGTSGSGKSTRVHALYRFLKTKVPYRIFFLNKSKKPIGTLFDDHLLFLGKEIQRGKRVEYQGADIVYRSIGGTHHEFYDTLFNLALSYSVVVETAVILRTHRSRPASIATTPFIGKFNVYGRFFYFDLDSPEGFEAYYKRINDRSGNTPTITSSMWISNRDFYHYINHFNEEVAELPEEYRGLFQIEKGEPSEDVTTIGIEILKREGMEELIPEFIEFCRNNVKILDSPNIKKRVLF